MFLSDTTQSGKNHLNRDYIKVGLASFLAISYDFNNSNHISVLSMAKGVKIGIVLLSIVCLTGCVARWTLDLLTTRSFLHQNDFYLNDPGHFKNKGYSLVYGCDGVFEEIVGGKIVEVHYDELYILCTRKAGDSLEYYVVSIPDYITDKSGVSGPLSAEAFASKVDSLGLDVSQMIAPRIR